MPRYGAILALVIGVLAPVSSALGASPSGSIGVRLLDAPTNRRADPRARAYIVDHLPPGRTIRRRIGVYNETSTAQRIAVYPAAATIANGAFTFADAHTPDEVSTWTSLDRALLDVPAGRSTTITATIRVPRDASPGERYAVVWAEVHSPSRAGGLSLVNRVGIRIYLSVGPGGEPASNFQITRLTAGRLPTGQPVVVATIHNTGGRALDLSGTLKLTGGPGAMTAGPFPATLGSTLGPGDVEPVSVPLDRRLPDGPWRAAIHLQSGLLARSASGMITFPATASGITVGRAESKPARQLPYLLLVMGLALLLFLLLAWLWRRRRRDRRLDRPGQIEPPRFSRR